MATRITAPKARKRLVRLEPRKTAVQSRSRATVEQVLIAAAQVFDRLGYAGGTTNRIAKLAGVSVGTLYQYFPSKEAIAVALLESHVDDTSRKLHEWIGHMVSMKHSLRDAIEDYVRGIMEVHEAKPRLQHMLLEETPMPERLHQLLLRAEQQAVESMAGLLRLFPEVRGATTSRSGYFVIHTVESLTHRFVAHPDEQILSQDEFVFELVTMLESYLTRVDGMASLMRAAPSV